MIRTVSSIRLQLPEPFDWRTPHCLVSQGNGKYARSCTVLGRSRECSLSLWSRQTNYWPESIVLTTAVQTSTSIFQTSSMELGTFHGLTVLHFKFKEVTLCLQISLFLFWVSLKGVISQDEVHDPVSGSVWISGHLVQPLPVRATGGEKASHHTPIGKYNFDHRMANAKPRISREAENLYDQCHQTRLQSPLEGGTWV